MDYNQSIIFIPSYQPENVLVCLAKALKEKGYEVLIVDDGSGDKYRSIFDEASLYSTVLHYENNHGKGYALKYGFKYKDTDDTFVTDLLKNTYFLVDRK